MILRITRHGQPALADMPKGANYELPDNDYVLTPLGREQAEFLGNRLKKENFKGRIISSPYARTMETASIIGAICGVTVSPEPRFQERLFYDDAVCPGMTMEELRSNYPNIAPEATLAHPWIVLKGPEPAEDVEKRVWNFLDELLAAPPAEDILLAGHGASVGAATRYLVEKANYTGNCGISFNAAVCIFEICDDGSVKLIEPWNTDHIPVEKVTSNKRSYAEVMAEL
ncbi:MAG: histidine phosphatase family protein [Lentisphaeria bacterium]|nr:histidine phosphatase family protein [Lentisphaeria bacterium]